MGLWREKLKEAYLVYDPELKKVFVDFHFYGGSPAEVKCSNVRIELGEIKEFSIDGIVRPFYFPK